MKPQPWCLIEIKAITPLCVLSWYRVNMSFHACTPVCGNNKRLFRRALADLNIKAENLFRCVPHMLFPTAALTRLLGFTHSQNSS